MVIASIMRSATRFSRSGVTHCCRRAFYSTDNKEGLTKGPRFMQMRHHLGRYYTKKHEWVSMDSGIGTIGISSYAQEALGEVVFVQLPDVGRTVAAGDECGALESVKAASEVYTPVSGTITEKNDTVESTPSLINKSCYEEGWLFRVKLSTPDEIQKLMNQTEYEKYLEESH